VRVVLDGVFNHCGRGFFAFNDIIENGEHSPYKDWFYVDGFPVNSYDESKPKNFATWWDFRSMPKFNTANPAGREYIFDVARYWIELGADGWRLDVPNEIDDDSFWAEFRYVVKDANPDAYLVGEIWEEDPRWVGGEHFDGLMNYPLREALIAFLNAGDDSSDFAERVESLLERYPHEHVYAMFVPLGSHDTKRLMTVLGGDLDKVKLAFAFQFAFPGAPAVYYGDEVGLEGGEDPECRRAFPWQRQEWNRELRSWVARLISQRKRRACLRRGDFQRVLHEKKRCTYAFARKLGDQAVLVVLNASSSRNHLRLPVKSLGWSDGRIVRDLLDGEEFIVSGDELVYTAQPWSGVWIG
jgi:glycosidase